MEKYSYGSAAGKMIPSEQSISNVPRKNAYKQHDSTNLSDPKDHADYSLYQHPGNINLVDQSGYSLEETPYYNHGELNTTPSMNLYHGGDMYVISDNNSKGIMAKPNNTFNIPGPIPSKRAPDYDYINSGLNLNQGDYYNPYPVINNLVPSSENVKYDLKSEMDGEYVIPGMNTKINNSYLVNVNNSSNVSGKIGQNGINGYIDPDSYTNLYEHGSASNSVPIMSGIASMPDVEHIATATHPTGVGNVNYDFLMHNYNAALCNNINSVNSAHNLASMGYLGGLDISALNAQPYGANFNSVNYGGANFGEANFGSAPFEGSHLGDVNFHSFPKEDFALVFDKQKEADMIGDQERKCAKLKSTNHTEGIHSHKHPPEHLQAILCLQKLEEIPTPFLNLRDIKYSVSVYFNTYDDILEKYQSQFYSCKLNESNTYADCDLKNEIIKLPFNNEEFIYLKVIETSVYKTEVTGRLQLKVKSLSQEYPLRIPIIGDDGNSKGFLIMNFFITSSYYDVKNDLLITDQSSLPKRPKSTRIRRKNNGFHFFENFTKWCCEITDHHMN
ncbi:hypothetical protein AK88_02168 [Plasmodium fragile]|uniref:Uncharacterized protein n=1 Tax=Plasmodium fragile TaxID=5857 RepID=A0A0D9QRB9_PLAFR|nr:uncharacterized protein AK88_02168 [Plasmodium fragile]KJP88221.1 hypothetical protein AK88_02168 [Plasmodium fragile]